MTQAYEATGLIASYNAGGSTKNVTVHGTWNHASWVPDVVIANIGGNDWTNKIKNLSGDERTAAENQFKDAVISLLTRIHNLYPAVKVVWTVNSTTSGNGKLAKDAIDTLSFSNSVLLVSIDTTKDGADDHAGIATHDRNATAVATAIHDSFHLPYAAV